MPTTKTGELTAAAIADEFRSGVKSYAAKTPIHGVKVHRLTRFVDDRGFFQ
jgi:dTDP-4-dehydrorhamnose 3,5-epimerase-like enzyme